MTARSPEDLLAMVPVVLGFTPEQSVVMLTFGAEHTFHARVDVPLGPEEVDEVVEALLEPACRNGVRRVVLLVYSADETLARRCGKALERAFKLSGIDVLEMLRADGQRWFPLVGRRPGVPAWGVPYDISAHRFLAQAVVEGRVTHRSRDVLAATLDRRPDQSATVAVLVAELPVWDQTQLPTVADLLTEGEWVRATVARHTTRGSGATDAEVARLLRGMQVKRIRDAAWSVLSREVAEAHVDFWTDIVRRTPDPLVAPPATLLGWAAWQAGHGALAWCAVERCAQVDPAYTLMIYLAQMLEHAVPPTHWECGVDWALGLVAG